MATAIATAVGDRTWRSWAGRVGGADFAPSDVALGLWRAAKWHLHNAAPPAGHRCPICFDTPESTSEWQRLWCGCAVCQTCVGTWVKTALDSSAGATITEDHTGQPQPPFVSLSCPACSAPLRPCDAAKVLASDDALLHEYDLALRDASLRGQRDFRPCPNCKGGGFVTWRCVAQARNASRTAALLLANVVCVACVLVGSRGRLSRAVAASTYHDLALLALISVLARLGASTTRTMAHEAGAAAPLEVGCPECEQRFSLAAADATADAAAPGMQHNGANAGDDAWVREHTRPCPRCRAPILKNGGCNAMSCARCKLNFCWACMRASRECTHFTCANGAPHGNASLWTEAAAADGDALARAGAQAELIATVSAAIADATALCASAAFGLVVGGAHESAREVALWADALLALPADAWFAVCLPLISSLSRFVMLLVSYGALGLLLLVVGPFVLHALGVEMHEPDRRAPARQEWWW